jgi:DNA-binding transcriptional ArsR family regulator
MLNRLVPTICAIPYLPFETTSGLNDPQAENASSRPHFWRRIPMAREILTMKKATKTALAKNETLLRTKTIQRAASLLKQISDPTRLQIVSLLSKGERHVGGLCDQFNMSQPAVSHHLAMMRHGGIIERRRRGKNNVYTLTDTGDRLAKIVNGMVR